MEKTNGKSHEKFQTGVQTWKYPPANAGLVHQYGIQSLYQALCVAFNHLQEPLFPVLDGVLNPLVNGR